MGVVLFAIALLIVLIFARVPVAFSLFTAGAAGLVLLDGWALTGSQLGRIPYRISADALLLIVPLFILMGVLAARSTIAEDGFQLAAHLLRRVPGGLGVAAVAGCAAFAAVSGSSVATASAMSRVSIGELRAAGYPRTLAAGIVGASGTLGILIPPSVGLVLYAVIARESVGRILIAGFVPGAISALVYGAAIVFYGYRARDRLRAGATPARGLPSEQGPAGSQSTENGEAPIEPSNLRKRAVGSLRIGIIGFIILGGIYTGVTTTIEAAALGAFVTFVFFAVELWRTRRGFRQLADGLRESILTTGMVFALLIGGATFTTLLVRAGVPAAVTTWILGLDVAPHLLIVIILLALIPLGMFLDPLSTMLIAVPLTHPVAVALGFEGVWFAILFVKTIEIGLVTPPFGLNAFVVAGSAEGISVTDAFKGVLLFLPLDLLTIAFFFTFPVVVTWLPNQMA